MKTPRVTVLMSVHNGGSWLREAMDSILRQTWRDYEFLIIDDASTDDSSAKIAGITDPRIRLIRLAENIGLTRSLNIGLREARGELIARQDSDDVSAPERLAKQVAYLDAQPQVAVVGAQGKLIDAQGRFRGNRVLPREDESVRWLSLFDNPVIHSAAMFRAQVVRQVGGYDETFPTCQDYDLWQRVLELNEIHNLADRLIEVREHRDSISAIRGSESRLMVKRVVERIAKRNGLELSADSMRVLLAFRRHLKSAETTPFYRVVTEWDRCFSSESPDLALTRSGVSLRIAYNLITSDRPAALANLASALWRYPAMVADIPWLRIAALFVFGEKARRLRKQ